VPEACSFSDEVLAQSRDLYYLKRAREDRDLFLDLIRRLQAGERGVDAILLRAHYPKLLQIVRRYGRALAHDHDDLMQEARLAMLEACARFDLDSEDSAVGFVWLYVKSYVCRYVVDLGEVVRVPCHLYSKRRGDGTHRYGVRNVYCFSEMADEAREGWNERFEDALVDDRPSPEDAAALLEHLDLGQRLLRERLSQLSLQEHEVLRRRFLYESPDGKSEGAVQGKPGPVMDGQPTLADVGREQDLSRERIRQVEAQALQKMRKAMGKTRRKA